MDKILELLLSNPELAKPMVSEMVNKYKPIAYAVGSELLNVYSDFANNKEYFKTVATSRKNQFDAYIEVGFTSEQAMTLLLKDLNNVKKLSDQVSNSTKNASKNK